METTTSSQTPASMIKKVTSKLTSTVLFIIALVIVIFWFIAVRNNLASLDQGVKSKQAQIETDLNRRFDLVPNLVETVKGVTKQEQEVFGKIAEARSRYAGATTDASRQEAMGEYQSALSRLLVITENYPQLKSSDAFQNLMAQLEGTENRIAVARKDYNTAIETYNKALVRFPSNLVARLFGYSEKAFYQAPSAAQTAPQVRF